LPLQSWQLLAQAVKVDFAQLTIHVAAVQSLPAGEDRQMPINPKPGFIASVAIAAVATACTLALQSLSQQPFSHLDSELISTILLVSSTAAVVSALVSASIFRSRPVLMVVVSQIIAISLIAFVAR
jgi:hypothetical protein